MVNSASSSVVPFSLTFVIFNLYGDSVSSTLNNAVPSDSTLNFMESSTDVLESTMIELSFATVKVTTPLFTAYPPGAEISRTLCFP